MIWASITKGSSNITTRIGVNSLSFLFFHCEVAVAVSFTLPTRYVKEDKQFCNRTMHRWRNREQKVPLRSTVSAPHLQLRYSRTTSQFTFLWYFCRHVTLAEYKGPVLPYVQHIWTYITPGKKIKVELLQARCTYTNATIITWVQLALQAN